MVTVTVVGSMAGKVKVPVLRRPSDLDRVI